MRVVTPTATMVLALTLWGEARGEIAAHGRASLEAVASVVWFRAAQMPDGTWGSRVRRACLAPRQFSCWHKTGGVSLPRRCAEWDLCVAVATEVVEQGLAWRAPIRADHYHATWMRRPPAWAARMRPVATIGHHVFFASGNVPPIRAAKGETI
jgi:spore germination cell wall hydrolase CwlJ-like protein